MYLVVVIKPKCHVYILYIFSISVYIFIIYIWHLKLLLCCRYIFVKVQSESYQHYDASKIVVIWLSML